MVTLTDLTNGPKMFQETFGSKWGPRLWRVVFTIVVIAIATAAMSEIFGSWRSAYLEIAGWFSPSPSSPPKGPSQPPMGIPPSNTPATATPTPQPATPQPAPTLSREEKDAKIEVWKLVVQRMDDLAALLDQGDEMLETWLRDTEINRSAEMKKAQDFAGAASNIRIKLESTHDSIAGNYADIADLLKVTVRPPGRGPVPGSIFDQFMRSSGDFSNELISSPESDPQKLQRNLVAIAQILRKDIKAVRSWEQESRRIGQDQISSLSH
jgi:hypothetical protein